MYAATVDGKRLTFDVFGVWRKNMVMNDRETGTIWQHASGEALDGALKSRRLEMLPGWETTWGELRATYPKATYAADNGKYKGLLPKAALQRVLRITHVTRLDGLTPRDQRLEAHEMVIGVVVNGEAKAYPLSILRSISTLSDVVNGVRLDIRYIPGGDRVVIQKEDGALILYERQWWLGWSEFHPHSTIYEKVG